MSAGISYSPESMAYTLFDGTNSLKLPNWAHMVIHEEFEREVRPLRNSIDVLSGALDANRKDKERLCNERDRLSDENAKLRELVLDMWEGYNDPRCEECHLKDTPTCADCPICAREASVIDRMRELGIEVSDD